MSVNNLQVSGCMRARVLVSVHGCICMHVLVSSAHGCMHVLVSAHGCICMHVCVYYVGQFMVHDVAVLQAFENACGCMHAFDMGLRRRRKMLVQYCYMYTLAFDCASVTHTILPPAAGHHHQQQQQWQRHHHQFTIIIIIVPFDAPIHTYLYPPDTTPLVIWLPAFHVVGHRLLLPFPLLATAAGDNVMMRCCCSYWLVLTMLLQPILTLYDSSIIANV